MSLHNKTTLSKSRPPLPNKTITTSNTTNISNNTYTTQLSPADEYNKNNNNDEVEPTYYDKDFEFDAPQYFDFELDLQKQHNNNNNNSNNTEEEGEEGEDDWFSHTHSNHEVPGFVPIPNYYHKSSPIKLNNNNTESPLSNYKQLTVNITETVSTPPTSSSPIKDSNSNNNNSNNFKKFNFGIFKNISGPGRVSTLKPERVSISMTSPNDTSNDNDNSGINDNGSSNHIITPPHTTNNIKSSKPLLPPKKPIRLSSNTTPTTSDIGSGGNKSFSRLSVNNNTNPTTTKMSHCRLSSLSRRFSKLSTATTATTTTSKPPLKRASSSSSTNVNYNRNLDTDNLQQQKEIPNSKSFDDISSIDNNENNNINTSSPTTQILNNNININTSPPITSTIPISINNKSASSTTTSAPLKRSSSINLYKNPNVLSSLAASKPIVKKTVDNNSKPRTSIIGKKLIDTTKNNIKPVAVLSTLNNKENGIKSVNTNNLNTGNSSIKRTSPPTSTLNGGILKDRFILNASSTSASRIPKNIISDNNNIKIDSIVNSKQKQQLPITKKPMIINNNNKENSINSMNLTTIGASSKILKSTTAASSTSTSIFKKPLIVKRLFTTTSATTAHTTFAPQPR